jgi:ATP/ADP translocase
MINNLVLKHNCLGDKSSLVIQESKTKLSIVDSFKLILRSKYIGHIVLLMVCYGLLINILEGPWKSKVRELYPSTIDYVNFMGRFNIWMGFSCVAFMVIGSNVLRKVSWLISALVTPLMLFITGLIFFIFVIFADDLNLGNSFNPIYAAVIVGAIQNILSKSTKYSLFDSTKEMTYIPLPLELKTKGKAAVEVIGTKLGKSLGAFIQSTIFIFMTNSTFDSIISSLMIIFVVVVIIWVWDVVKLNQEYLKLCNKDVKETNL